MATAYDTIYAVILQCQGRYNGNYAGRIISKPMQQQPLRGLLHSLQFDSVLLRQSKGRGYIIECCLLQI